MLGLRGHLGDRASALVDGQLSPDEADQAWGHVSRCSECRQDVQRQTWLKSRLSAFAGPTADPEPDARLLGALYDVDAETRTAWQETDQIAARSHRRTLAVVGAGSVSAAVLGVLALTGSPAGQGERPAVRPAPARMSALIAGVGAQPQPPLGPVPVGLRSPAH